MRKLALLLMVTVIAAALAPVAAAAEQFQADGASLEQAILTVREILPGFPYAESRFESGFYNYYGRPIWRLYWYTQETKCTLRAEVDASSSELLSFSVYEPTDGDTYAALPQYSQDQAYSIAEQFLKTHYAEKLGQCRYLQQPPPRPVLQSRRWPVHYYFTWVRYVNDIPVPRNTLRVEVNGDTGAIVSFYHDWYDGDFPASEEMISPSEAQAALQAEEALELRYVWPSFSRGEEPQPLLAFVSQYGSNIYINAHTGELENFNYYHVYTRDAAEVRAMGQTDLSPEELREISENEQLLGQEEARALVAEMLELPEELELVRVSLQRDYRFPSVRSWQFDYRGKGEKENHYLIEIDASTGELLSLRHYEQSDEPLTSGQLTRAEAEQVARQFIEKYSPDKLAEVELVSGTETEDADADKKPLYYSFVYQRVVNGIPFPDNGFRVTVKASADPEVMDYQLRWVECEFPSAANAMDIADAYHKLSQEYPFELEYVITEREADSHADGSQTAVLVYVRRLPSTLFAHQDVSPISYNGKPIVVADEAVKPNDVPQNHWARQEILFLVETGIADVKDGQFRPDDRLTVGEWLELLQAACSWGVPGIPLPEWAQSAADKPYANLVKVAVNNQLILPGEDLNLERAITREELAAMAVRALGYEQIASLSNIFRLNCSDASAVSDKYSGHVALASGLKLMVGSAGRFRPQDSATRAEGAVVLMRMFKLSR